MMQAQSDLRIPGVALSISGMTMHKTYETPALEVWALALEADFLDGSVQNGGSEHVKEDGDELFG